MDGIAIHIEKPATEPCGCDNCMKLKCLFNNVSGLQSLVEYFKLAFSEDLHLLLQREINAFLNSDWNWQDDLVNQEVGATNIIIKEEYVDPNDESVEKCEVESVRDINCEEDEYSVVTPKIVIKSAAALFEDEEGVEEDIKGVVEETAATYVVSKGISQKQNLLRYEVTQKCGSNWMHCPVCDLSFKSLDQLQTHKRTHLLTQECNKCQMRFYSLEETPEHICPLLNGEGMSDVNEHEESFAGSNQDGSNEKMIDDEDDDDSRTKGEGLLKCQLCDTYFISKEELKEHEDDSHLEAMKDHASGVIYKLPMDDSYCCGLCGKTCKNLLSFNTHLRSRHKTNPINPPDNRCEVCGKAYDTLTRLRRHMSYQHGSASAETALQKPGNPCDVCGKTFPGSSYRLKRHYKTHTGERPCECEFCSKRFQNASHLNDHRRIHTGERPYKCLHCGNSYIQSSELKTHLRSRHRLSI